MKSDLRVFHWLEEISGEKTAYLKMLNLVVPASEISEHLKMWRQLGKRVEADRGYYWELMKDGNWRANLVACFCLLATNNRNCQKHLERKFLRGSFVSPQIAVALTLLHPKTTRDLFMLCLRSEFRGVKARSKELGAITALLPQIDPKIEKPVDPIIDELEFKIGERVATEHFKFWSKRIPLEN